MTALDKFAFNIVKGATNLVRNLSGSNVKRVQGAQNTLSKQIKRQNVKPDFNSKRSHELLNRRDRLQKMETTAKNSSRNARLGTGLGLATTGMAAAEIANSAPGSTLDKYASKNAKKERARIAGLSDAGKNKNKVGLTKSKYWQAVDGMADKRDNKTRGKEYGVDIGRAKKRHSKATTLAEKIKNRRRIHKLKETASSTESNREINKKVTTGGQERKSSFNSFAKMNRKSYPSESMRDAQRKKAEDANEGKKSKTGGNNGGSKNNAKKTFTPKKPMGTKTKIGLGLGALGIAGLAYKNAKDD